MSTDSIRYIVKGVGGFFGKIFSWNREDVLNISTAFNAWVFTHHTNGHDVLDTGGHQDCRDDWGGGALGDSHQVRVCDVLWLCTVRDVCLGGSGGGNHRKDHG